MVILNSVLFNPLTSSHFHPLSFLSSGIFLLLPTAELREDLWAEKEAERRQVGGTAGSQSQQLCQNLAFFPGSWILDPGSGSPSPVRQSSKLQNKAAERPKSMKEAAAQQP